MKGNNNDDLAEMRMSTYFLASACICIYKFIFRGSTVLELQQKCEISKVLPWKEMPTISMIWTKNPWQCANVYQTWRFSVQVFWNNNEIFKFHHKSLTVVWRPSAHTRLQSHAKNGASKLDGCGSTKNSGTPNVLPRHRRQGHGRFGERFTA